MLWTVGFRLTWNLHTILSYIYVCAVWQGIICISYICVIFNNGRVVTFNYICKVGVKKLSFLGLKVWSYVAYKKPVIINDLGRNLLYHAPLCGDIPFLALENIFIHTKNKQQSFLP
jgi:hypothetical protein